MLISFTVKNFLSFNKQVTLSFLASNKITELETNYNTILNTDILTSLAIFGNNASGKSNLLKAVNFSKNLILKSSSFLPNAEILGLVPFKLNLENIKEPSFFEYKFIIDDKFYRYNFSLNEYHIISENLYSKSYLDKRERVLFKREKQDIKIINFDDMGVSKNIKKNNLALSKFANENSEEALNINTFFQNIYVFLDGIKSNVDTINLLKIDDNNKFKEFLIDMFKITNSGIEKTNFIEKEQDISNLPIEIQNLIQKNNQFHKSINNNPKVVLESCTFLHRVNGSDNYSEFNLEEESLGTQKIFRLAGSLFNIIEKGKILFVDELDTSLSTKMIKYIINTFKNKNIAKSNKAQLVFTTNNTSLLDIRNTFRRDQIYFTDKKDKDFSDLYTLQDCKLLREDGKLINIRKDLVTIEKNYLESKIKKIN